MHIIASCATRVCNPTDPQWTSARPTTVLRRPLFLFTEQGRGLLEPYPRSLRLCDAAEDRRLATPELHQRSRRPRKRGPLKFNWACPATTGR
jgi:hypothetical protein